MVQPINFFAQLAEFSQRLFKHFGILERSSPWSYGTFTDGEPEGAILHYTTGAYPIKTMKWFMERQRESEVSAHVIIARDWPLGFLEMASDLPLVQELPTMIIQCLPPSQTAWHATWCNRTHYGIELVNEGEVRRDKAGGWVSCQREWTAKYKPLASPKRSPVFMAGRYWDPYGADQLLSVVEILRWLRKWKSDPLDPTQILGHELVQTAKFDPGPMFPLEMVRRTTFEDLHPTLYDWFGQFAKNLDYSKYTRNSLVIDWYRTEFAGYITTKGAWAEFLNQVDISFLKQGTDFCPLGKLILGVLGYAVSDLAIEGLTQVDIDSIKVFQHMMSLSIDGDPDMRTRAAMVARMRERGFAKDS